MWFTLSIKSDWITFSLRNRRRVYRSIPLSDVLPPRVSPLYVQLLLPFGLLQHLNLVFQLSCNLWHGSRY